MNRSHDRLWLAVRFPTLPITAVTDLKDTGQAVAAQSRIICANGAARAGGIVAGLDVTTARLLGGCDLLERNDERESEALSALEQRLYHFTPHIERILAAGRDAQGFVLEISSCLSLFGGGPALLEKIVSDLSSGPHEFRLGLGHTATAAWLLSKIPQPFSGTESREEFIARLMAVPVEGLEESEQVDRLQRMGFHTLGDIATQIESTQLGSLRKRFGSKFGDYLSDLFDFDSELSQQSLFQKPLPSFHPSEKFRESVQFDAPVSLVDGLKFPMELLLQKMEDYLRRRQLECQSVEWELQDIRRQTEVVRIDADLPQIGWELFYDLTLIHFEHRELPFEVDSLELACREEMAQDRRDQCLNFTSSRQAPVSAFERTAAKLRARLGDSKVYKLSYSDDLVPEQTQMHITLSSAANQLLPSVQGVALRPTWLFSKPEPISIKSQRLFWRGFLELIAGPERICGQWWDNTRARDYYMAQRHDGCRLWVYRDLQAKTWFVHGAFT